MFELQFRADNIEIGCKWFDTYQKTVARTVCPRFMGRYDGIDGEIWVLEFVSFDMASKSAFWRWR